MKGYIICFLITLFFTIISDLFFKRNKKRYGIFFLFLATAILILFAGIRSETVGTDIYTYVSPLFSEFSNGRDFFYVYEKYNVEFGFTLLVYIFSIFKSLNAVLTGIALMVISPICIYSYKVRNKISISLNYFIFYTTMYCYSFSMMRQSISISIGLLALYYMINNEKKKSIILIIIAILFHRTAMILFLFQILVSFVKDNSKQKFLYLILISFLGIVFIFLAPIILPTKYLNYFNTGVTSVNILSIIKKLIWIVPITFYIGKIKDKTSEKYFILKLSIYILAFDLIIYTSGLIVPAISRLSLYFYDINMFLIIPYLINMLNPKFVSKFLFLSIMLFFWWNMTISDTSSNIYPYKSDIVSNLNETR